MMTKFRILSLLHLSYYFLNTISLLKQYRAKYYKDKFLFY